MQLSAQALEQRRAMKWENIRKYRERKAAGSTSTLKKSPLKIKLDLSHVRKRQKKQKQMKNTIKVLEERAKSLEKVNKKL